MSNLKGWRTLGFNLLLVIAPPALAYLASVQWTDYVSPVWAPVVIGAIGIGLRLVTTGPAGMKMVILLALVVASAAIAGSPSFAADINKPTIPLKGLPAVTPCTIDSCTGLYGGLDFLMSGSSFNITPGTAAQNDLALGGHVGAQFWNGKFFAAVEGGGDYGVYRKGDVPGMGNQGLWDAYGLFKGGYALSNLFGVAQTGQAAPTLPTSIAQSLMTPYFILGAYWRPWGVGFAAGAGVEALLATNWTLAIDYINVNYNNAAINPIVSQQNENIIRASLDYHF